MLEQSLSHQIFTLGLRSGRCGLIHHLSLPVCHQGHLAYLVILLCYLCFFVFFCYPASLWFLVLFSFSFQNVVSYLLPDLFIHGVKTLDPPYLPSCTIPLYQFLKGFFFFDGSKVWIQGCTLARQTLYHLNHTSSSFCFGYFEERILLFAQTGLDHNPPIFCFPPSLRWHMHATVPNFFPMSWGLTSFFAGLAWNHYPDLSLPLSLGWQVSSTAPSYWLRWGLVELVALTGLEWRSMQMTCAWLQKDFF
jgi:hypothetical protein